MAINETINSIKEHLTNAYNKAEEKGAVIPDNKNIENLTETFSSIPNGKYRVESIDNGDGTQTLNIYDWDYVPATSFDRVFGNNSWETISNISAEISAQNMTSAQVEETYGWKIGDIKQETLTTGEVIELQIIGVNHDDRSDGSGKAGLTLQMVNCLATRYPMNSSFTNAGGWGASKMRTETMPTIKATLSSELQSVIKLVDKKAANGSGSNYSATETLSDDLFLLAGIEIFGNESSYGYAQDGANEGTQYSWYAQHNTNADRIKKYDNDGDGVPETATYWWERSSRSGYTSHFCSVNSNGNADYGNANLSRGVAFGFCI